METPKSKIKVCCHGNQDFIDQCIKCNFNQCYHFSTHEKLLKCIFSCNTVIISYFWLF